ncbi:MAG: hypothetical protein AAF310_02670 [Myxococcota bacterium]
MEKFFNTAGPLNPAKHYALDPLKRWDLSAEAAQVACHDVTQAMENLLGTLALEAQDQLDDPWVEQNWQNMLQRYKSLNAFTAVLRGWCLHNPKPLVLLLDEKDSCAYHRSIVIRKIACVF